MSELRKRFKNHRATLTIPKAGEDVEQQSHTLLVEMPSDTQPLWKTVWTNGNNI